MIYTYKNSKGTYYAYRMKNNDRMFYLSMERKSDALKKKPFNKRVIDSPTGHPIFESINKR